MPADRPPDREITAMLESPDEADGSKLDKLVALIYRELREIAHRQLDGARDNLSIQTSDLVHEAYLGLAGGADVTRRGRAYFYGAAARAMRQVLIDAARRKKSIKRGRGIAMLELDEANAAVTSYAGELLDLDEALDNLEKLNSRQARVVECRYFGGLSVEETAAALDVSPRTVKSDWALARAWLFAVLKPG